MNKWVEEILLRKVVMNVVKLSVAYGISHLANVSGHLSLAGVSVQVDPVKLTDFLNGAVFIGLHELHMLAISKYPTLARYI